MESPALIKGNIHQDNRGILRFVNEFDFKEVKRFYTISPEHGLIRAWQGHLKEVKWFYVSQGSFEIQAYAMNSLGKPVNPAQNYTFYLSATESDLLFIPAGFLNGFKSLEPNAVLTVFSNFNLEDSMKDDFRLSLDNLPWKMITK